MSTLDLHEQVQTCPFCHADNTLVSNYVPPHTAMICSSCREVLGTVADMRDAHVPLNPEDRAIQRASTLLSAAIPLAGFRGKVQRH